MAGGRFKGRGGNDVDKGRYKTNEHRVAAELKELLLEPILALKPPDPFNAHPVVQWVNSVFGSQCRDLVYYKARRPFEMPGLYRAGGGPAIQGIGNRKVSAGKVMLVRTDSRMPDIVDVEIRNGFRGEWQVFLLDQSQWNFVLGFVEEIKGSGKV